MMKLQDVLLKAMARKIRWPDAGEIVGVTDRTMRRWRERLEEHGIELSYTWVKRTLQGAGLVKRCMRRGVHRRRRARRPLLAALWEVVETQGLFCALYSDRAGHFFLTPKAGEPLDKYRLTQVGRALREVGIQMIAYSPQARGRSERSFGTWQGRLPQELRLAGIATVEGANQFLRDRYIAEFNRKFAVPAAEKGTAFRPRGRRDLEWVFSVQNQRVVAKDNTVALRERAWQLEQSHWRCTLAGCTVTIHEHLNGTVSVRYGPPLVGRFTANGAPLSVETAKKPRGRGKVEISQTTRDSHFPTATTTIPSLTKRKTSKRAA